MGHGRFLTIEGGEGVGKTALLQRLIAALQTPKREVIATREPGGTTVAESIRAVFSATTPNEPLCPETELFLISAARAQHVKFHLQPALKRGAWIICDRFADSTRVYQGYVGGLASTLIESVISASTFGLEPHITFYLDCPVEIAQERMKLRSSDGKAIDGVSRYDGAKLALHKKLREGFLDLAKHHPQRIVILDATQPAEKVAQQALQLIKERF